MGLCYSRIANSATSSRKPIVAQLNQAIVRIVKTPEMEERLRNDDMEAAHNMPEELSRFIAADIAKWTKVVKAGDIKVD